MFFFNLCATKARTISNGVIGTSARLVAAIETASAVMAGRGKGVARAVDAVIGEGDCAYKLCTLLLLGGPWAWDPVSGSYSYKISAEFFVLARNSRRRPRIRSLVAYLRSPVLCAMFARTFDGPSSTNRVMTAFGCAQKRASCVSILSEDQFDVVSKLQQCS
jgi:hypothetical protein